MNNENKNFKPTIGLCDLLTVVFIVLKLLGKITWSWVWVLSPIWISMSIFVIALVIAIIAEILNKRWNEMIDLKLKRVEKGHMTQRDLSEATGVNRTTISNIENGKQASVKTSKILAEFFGIDWREFYER